MRIISKFKDYYDCIMGQYGIDNSIIYKRNNEIIKLDRNDTFIFTHKLFKQETCSYYKPNITKDNMNILPKFVWFCGKIYVYYMINYYDNGLEVTNYVYDKDEIFKLFETYNSSYTKPKEIKRKIALFKTEYERINGSKILNDLFITFNTPIFALSFDTKWNYFSANLRGRICHVELNPNLKDIQFYKLFNPVDAFQELSMFIGNVLTNTAEIPQIDEKYRMAQRGLDKTSFRQDAPGIKKEKRRANKKRKRNKKL